MIAAQELTLSPFLAIIGVIVVVAVIIVAILVMMYYQRKISSQVVRGKWRSLYLKRLTTAHCRRSLYSKIHLAYSAGLRISFGKKEKITHSLYWITYV